MLAAILVQPTKKLVQPTVYKVNKTPYLPSYPVTLLSTDDGFTLIVGLNCSHLHVTHRSRATLTTPIITLLLDSTRLTSNLNEPPPVCDCNDDTENDRYLTSLSLSTSIVKRFKQPPDSFQLYSPFARH
jgi:hypothetical protein